MAAAKPRTVAPSNRVFKRDLLRIDVLPSCNIGMARGRRKCLLAIIAMFLLHREWPLIGDWEDEFVKESRRRRSLAALIGGWTPLKLRRRVRSRRDPIR